MIGLMEPECADGGISLIIKKIYMARFLITLVISGIISYLWVRGINKMKDEHPDYKGDDFLNFKKDEKDKIHK